MRLPIYLVDLNYPHELQVAISQGCPYDKTTLTKHAKTKTSFECIEIIENIQMESPHDILLASLPEHYKNSVMYDTMVGIHERIPFGIPYDGACKVRNDVHLENISRVFKIWGVRELPEFVENYPNKNQRQRELLVHLE